MQGLSLMPLFMIMTVLLGMWSFGVVTITWGWARMN
jgi:hypothetical protein